MSAFYVYCMLLKALEITLILEESMNPDQTASNGALRIQSDLGPCGLQYRLPKYIINKAY